MIDNILRDTIVCGVPASRNLTSDEAIEPKSLGNEKCCALLETNAVLARLKLEDFDFVAVLTLELLSCLFRRLKLVKILFNLDLLEKLLLFGVVSLEEFWLDETDTGVFKDLFLILGLDVFVVDRLICLRINPAGV